MIENVKLLETALGCVLNAEKMFEACSFTRNLALKWNFRAS
jgi:hypothetical protein